MRKWLVNSGLWITLLFVLFACVACSDYVAEMENDFEVWKAAQMNVVPEESSSSTEISQEPESSNGQNVSSDSELHDDLTSSSGTMELGSSSSVDIENPDSSESNEDPSVRVLSVMMFDWLHGDRGDGVYASDSTYANGAKDLYYGDPIYAVSNDFGSGGCYGSYNNYRSNAKDSRGTPYMAGMVEPVLGANGVPVRSATFPEECLLTDHLDYWFLPVVIGQDAGGKQYTNSTCRAIELTLDSEGFWGAQKDRYSPEGGLFFLDDFQYLDDARTVPNIFYDNLRAQTGKSHNFGFTMKVQAKFEYVPGQTFEFNGDDDAWVFINNRLVIDLGGQHSQVYGAVNLDTLGLVVGEKYPFHIFYAERHISSSNFKIRTSIDLKTDETSSCH